MHCTAMAAGLPVLASNLEGPAEIIDNEKYGWLFEPENIEHCADKIFQIYNDYGSSNFMQKIGLSQKRATDFDIDLMVNSLEAYYLSFYNQK